MRTKPSGRREKDDEEESGWKAGRQEGMRSHAPLRRRERVSALAHATMACVRHVWSVRAGDAGWWQWVFWTSGGALLSHVHCALTGREACILCQPWLVLTSRGGPNRICPFLTSSPVAHQHSIRHSMLRCWKVKERATPAASLASGLFLTGPDPDRKLKGKMTFQTR